MAIVGQKFTDIADVLKRTDPDNQIAAIIELMTETNQLMEDAVFMEGNLPTGHRHTIRTGLPSGTWRKMYQGVQPTKSTTAQVDDTIGQLEAYSVVDAALASLNGNESAYRMSEAVSFLEGMGQDFAETMIYGNTDINPERFMGLAPRYSGISTDPKQIGYNVIDGGGTGSDNTSLWFVTWGERHTSCIYPKGSMAGLQRTDKGQVTQQLADGSKFEALEEHFCHRVGLAVSDWRNNVRVANLSNADMQAGSVELEMLMIEAYGRLKRPLAFDASRTENTYIYCNEQVWTALNKRALQRNSSCLSIDTWNGRPQLNFWGIPIKKHDAIINTEARVVAA